MFFVNVSARALDLREAPSESSEVLDILHVGGVVEVFGHHHKNESPSPLTVSQEGDFIRSHIY